MHRPAISQLITKNESYYSLVIAVAKRARQIADELSANNQILEEKPVKIAVEEIFNVKVEKVNIVNCRPKAKRVGKYAGTTSAVRKAIVKLAEGHKINLI